MPTSVEPPASRSAFDGDQPNKRMPISGDHSSLISFNVVRVLMVRVCLLEFDRELLNGGSPVTVGYSYRTEIFEKN